MTLMSGWIPFERSVLYASFMAQKCLKDFHVSQFLNLSITWNEKYLYWILNHAQIKAIRLLHVIYLIQFTLNAEHFNNASHSLFLFNHIELMPNYAQNRITCTIFTPTFICFDFDFVYEQIKFNLHFYRQ